MLNVRGKGEKISMLRDNKVILLNFSEIVDMNNYYDCAWQDFKKTWNKLPVDNYMMDKGTYRQRRFSRFHLNIQSQILRKKEHAPYYQPSSLNPLNGDVLRYFEPILLSYNNTLFANLLKNIGIFLSEVDDKTEWDINVYQNRTLARPGMDGKPVPEGIHRDGVRYSIILGVDRTNVEGGESIIYNNKKDPILIHTITEKDVIIFCDEDCYHDTSKVELKNLKENIGFRDVLVIEYYTNVGNKNQIYVE